MASMSMGLMLRRLMTSTSTPYFFLRFSAATRALADAAAQRGDQGQVLALPLDLGLADGQDKVVALGLLRHGEALAVHQLVLEERRRVRVADGGLERPLASSADHGGQHLEAGDAAVPRASSPASAALRRPTRSRWGRGT